MSYRFGVASLKRCHRVHPHLVDCCLLGLERSEIDFSIICGVRTPEEQRALYAQGRTTAELRAKGIADVEGKPHLPQVTWTLNSNHFIRPISNFGHAVDLAPYVRGKIVWEPDELFDKIAAAMKSAAADLKIPLQWGFDLWGKDKPHFQLPEDYKGAI